MLLKTGYGLAPRGGRRMFMPPQKTAILGDSITRNNNSISALVLKHETQGF